MTAESFLVCPFSNLVCFPPCQLLLHIIRRRRHLEKDDSQKNKRRQQEIFEHGIRTPPEGRPHGPCHQTQNKIRGRRCGDAGQKGRQESRSKVEEGIDGSGEHHTQGKTSGPSGGHGFGQGDRER